MEYKIQFVRFSLTCRTGLAPVRNPQKLVATVSCREGVYNRAGEPSVIFAEKEELHSERETAKGCCERYGANDDVVERWLATAVDCCLFIFNLRLK